MSRSTDGHQLDESKHSATRASEPSSAPEGLTHRAGARRLLILLGAAVFGFSWHLFDLFTFALQSDLFSHIILVPAVSAYLIWPQRRLLRYDFTVKRSAVGLLLTGCLILLLYGAARLLDSPLPEVERLAAITLSFVLIIAGTCALGFSSASLNRIWFPLAFLVFMIPLPAGIVAGIEAFLQHGSAAVAFAMFSLAGTPVFRQDLVFHLPGIALEVAPECSGIRSTLALFITSVLAAHLFLRTRWRCGFLVAAVIPLALLRNGFRIFVIGELCVHVSPDMVHSFIHRQGGPLFFILSLIPFSLLLLLFVRQERRSDSGAAAKTLALAKTAPDPSPR